MKGIIKENIQIYVAVVQSPGHVKLFATPWTAACQASLSLIRGMCAQLCRTLCSPLDYSPVDFSVREIFQAEILD